MGLFDTFKKSAPAKDTASAVNQNAGASKVSSNSNTDQRGSLIVGVGRDPKAITHQLLFVGTLLDWSQTADRDLARLKPEWACEFAADVTQAVAALKTDLHAVVVHASVAGDTALVEALKKTSTKTVRVVLCDTSDRNEVAKWSATGANPITQTTDAANLAANISRIAQVQEWMLDAGIKKLVGQCRKLPSMPRLYSQISQELSSPDGSIETVARLIAQDPVMTAKILQIVNSAFFALGRQVSEPSDAVMFLGAERIRSLVLLAGVFTQFDGVSCPGF
jgi:hypothetical protein